MFRLYHNLKYSPSRLNWSYSANDTFHLVVGPERPIRSQSEDVLERERFIRRLTAALINENTRRATGVVIGITGPWGSGKSSILNLLREHIETTYEDALVVPYDPWLVSGRNDLISEFIRELIGTIKSRPKLKRKLLEFTKTVTKYGAQLAPTADLWLPGAGTAARGGLKALEATLSREESLHALRARLMDQLEKVSVPIVVIIDELDRVEDEEVRIVAQLVRSVADFPGISYVLAYDVERVVQALGAGVPDQSREERGRAYLEKIVQLQIPIPVIFSEEIRRLLTSDLLAMRAEFKLPEGFVDIERFQHLMEILVDDVIQTPRDIKRLIGSFHALAGMVVDEVDWVDLLAYCGLLIKAPRTVEKIKREPEIFMDDAFSTAAVMKQQEWKKLSEEERMAAVIPSTENQLGTRRLLDFLFPVLKDRVQGRSDYADALSLRRPLLTTLRLGLIPGAYARSDIVALVAKKPDAIAQLLRDAYEKEALDALIDRLNDLYPDLSDIDHVAFWTGVGDFLRKADGAWMSALSPMPQLTRNFADVLEHSAAQRPQTAAVAERVFHHLKNADEIALTARWLRNHLFIYGLFGYKARDREKPFLSAEEVAIIARELSERWRERHLATNLIPWLWDLQPIFTMLDVEVWDKRCQELLEQSIADDAALDGFTLMLYGGNYAVGKETIARMCSYDLYIERVRSRLASPKISERHGSVRDALKKANDGRW